MIFRKHLSLLLLYPTFESQVVKYFYLEVCIVYGHRKAVSVLKENVFPFTLRFN